MTRRQRSLHLLIWCLLPVVLLFALAAALRARTGSSSNPVDVSLPLKLNP